LAARATKSLSLAAIELLPPNILYRIAQEL
jgi:hypothetical protein